MENEKIVVSTGDGWQGVNYGKWHSEQELKKLILADFKSAGIKASIRFRRGGYGTHMTVTFKLKQDDVTPYYVWGLSWDKERPQWLYYRDDDGRMRWILYDDVLSMPYNEARAIMAKCRRTAYDESMDELRHGTSAFSERDKELLLTPDVCVQLAHAREIVRSYNYDRSDIMTDYFDRGYYDEYKLVLA